MVETLKGIYNRRHPERTDYYRIIENSFDDFERTYPDQFEEKYGYLQSPRYYGPISGETGNCSSSWFKAPIGR